MTTASGISAMIAGLLLAQVASWGQTVVGYTALPEAPNEFDEIFFQSLQIESPVASFRVRTGPETGKLLDVEVFSGKDPIDRLLVQSHEEQKGFWAFHFPLPLRFYTEIELTFLPESSGEVFIHMTKPRDWEHYSTWSLYKHARWEYLEVTGAEFLNDGLSDKPERVRFRPGLVSNLSMQRPFDFDRTLNVTAGSPVSLKFGLYYSENIAERLARWKSQGYLVGIKVENLIHSPGPIESE